MMGENNIMNSQKIPPLKRPWDKWENETDTAYHRFSIYMKMGPDRSISKVADKLQKGSGYAKHLRRWSSKYNWVERCRDYDQHIALQHVENQEIIQKKARSKVLGRLNELIDRLFTIANSADHDRMQAIEMLMEQAGMINQGDEANSNEMPTYQQINNYFADK